MTPKILVSYDGSANDDDALALGRVLAAAGAHLSLAYVRHARLADPTAEAAEQEAADRLLADGARAAGLPGAPRHVVLDRSTAEGLRRLAKAEHAGVVVFGSDHHLADGSVRPGRTAEAMLEGGPVAIALAVANQRARPLSPLRVAALAEGGDHAPEATARSLAAAFGGTVVELDAGDVDLLVIGSRPEVPRGRVSLSAVASYAIDTATSPVLVLPREAPVAFPAGAALAT